MWLFGEYDREDEWTCNFTLASIDIDMLRTPIVG